MSKHRQIALTLVVILVGALAVWTLRRDDQTAPTESRAATATEGAIPTSVEPQPSHASEDRGATSGAAGAPSSGIVNTGWFPGAGDFAYAQRWSSSLPKAMGAFRDWAERYRAAAPSERAVLEDEGVALARARRAEMIELIRQDPQLALALTVPATVRAILPDTVLAELEARVSGLGDYALVPVEPAVDDVGEHADDGLSRLLFLDGRSYRAHVYGRRLQQQTQERASLHGIALDGHFALHESPLRVLEPGEVSQGAIEPLDPVTGLPVAAVVGAGSILVEAQGRTWVVSPSENVLVLADELNAAEELPGPEVPLLMPADGAGSPIVAAATATPWTTGVKKILVIRVDFSDLPGVPVHRPTGRAFSIADWKAFMDEQIAGYYEACSYGKVSLACSVADGVYRMPLTAETYALNGDIAGMHADALAVSGLDVSGYDVVAIAHGYIGPNWNPESKFTWAGIAYVGGTKFWLNGYFDLRVFAHELGHTYGLLHANFWQTSDGNPVSSNGSKVEYGDVFDVMGSGRDQTHHFNEAYKNQLGWLPDERVLDVTQSGTYRLFRFDRESPVSGQPLALRVNRDGVFTYWIGYRRPNPYAQIPQDGLYALWMEKGRGDSRSLDLSPGNDRYDVSLPVGSTFDDAEWHVSFDTLATGGSGANGYVDVKVTIGPRDRSSAVPVWGSGSALSVPSSLSGVRSIASGTGHMMALRDDGTVVTWGGDPSIFAPPAELNDAVGIAGGSTVSAAIRQSGDLVLWGWSIYDLLTPPAAAVGVRQVALGSGHALALRDDGTVIGWGDNGSNKSVVPATVRDAVAIETGDFSSFVLQADGTVVGWGAIYSAAPAGLTDVVAVSSGEAHTLALKRDGTVVGWGAPNIDARIVPQGLANVRSVVAAGRHSLALLEDGSVVAWGEADSPQSTVPADLPAAMAITGGNTHSAVLPGSGAPTITVQPWSRTISSGASAKFTTFAVGDGALGYRWQRQAPGETTWSEMTNGGAYSGTTTTTLQVSGATAVLSGETYRCIVTGSTEPAAASDAVALIVEGALVGVAKQPADANAVVHQSASFTVAPYGVAPFTYQWFKDGVALSGATAAQLVIADVTIGNAGSYTVTVSNEHGSVSSSPATLTVRKWTQSINFPAPGPRTFGDAPLALNATASSNLPVNYSVTGPGNVSGNTLTLTGAGTVVVTARQSGNSEYAPAAGVTREIAVSKAHANVSLSALSPVYDGQAKPAVVTTVPAGLAVSISYSGSSAAPANAGTYAVVATVDDANYEGSAAGSLVIAKAVPSVAWPAPAAISFGTPLSATQLNATSSVSGNFNYTPPAGSILVAATAHTLSVVFTPADGANYSQVTAGTTLEVERAAQSITFPSIANQPLSAGSIPLDATSSSGLPVVFSVSGPASVNSGVLVLTGTGTVAITATQAGDSNHLAAAPVTRSFAVVDAHAAVTLDGLNAIYDGSAKNVTVSTIPAGLAAGVTYDGNATAPVNAGTYTVVATIDDPVYTGSVIGTLVIAKATPALSWDEPAAIVYGTPLSAAQLDASAGVLGSFVYAPSLGAVPAAGEGQVLDAVFTPVDTDNYSTASITVPLTVSRAPLTVTAGNQTRTYAAPNPPLSVKYSGFVNGDTEAVLTSTPVTSTPASVASAVGVYPITVNGGAADNYVITRVPGTLTITEASASITISDTIQTFDGTPRPVSVSTVPSGLSVKINYNGGEGAPQDPGSYEVNVFIDDSNYAGAATATLVIHPADPAGDYFGTFANGGNWAMHVGAGSRGRFVGFLPDGAGGFVFDVLVGFDGSFSGSGNLITVEGRSSGDVTLEGRIVGAAVSGELPGMQVTFTGARDALNGPARDLAGFYEASAINVASGAAYAVIGSSGQAMVLLVTAGVIDGGSATVNEAGRLTANLAGSSQVDLVVNATSGGFDGTVTPFGATEAVSMSGLSAAVTPVNRIINLSTRGFVGTGDDVMIIGFVIAGSGNKSVLVRAVGPTLGAYGVGGAIADPVISLRRQTDGVEISGNDNWSSGSDSDRIADAMAQVGAFALETGTRDAALLADLPAGAYTVIVSGVDSATGVALAELYSIDDSEASSPHLVNISTRGIVGTGDAVMIPGFVSEGNAPRRLLVRGVGPGLPVANALPDPVIAVFVKDGSAPVATSDDWDTSGSGDEIAEVAQTIGAFALPAGSKDAALLITIPPGTPYTIHISDSHGGTGVLLAEVYEIP